MVFSLKNEPEEDLIDKDKLMSRYGHDDYDYPLFTPQVEKDLLDGVKNGLGETTNIRNAGILPSTFYRWRRDARENWESNPTHPLVVFFKKYDKEDARYQRKLLNYVDAMSNPKLAMQLLEKRYKDDFGKTETVEHTGEVSANVSMQDRMDRLSRIMKNDEKLDEE